MTDEFFEHLIFKYGDNLGEFLYSNQLKETFQNWKAMKETKKKVASNFDSKRQHKIEKPHEQKNHRSIKNEKPLLKSFSHQVPHPISEPFPVKNSLNYQQISRFPQNPMNLDLMGHSNYVWQPAFVPYDYVHPVNYPSVNSLFGLPPSFSPNSNQSFYEINNNMSHFQQNFDYKNFKEFSSNGQNGFPVLNREGSNNFVHKSSFDCNIPVIKNDFEKGFEHYSNRPEHFKDYSSYNPNFSESGFIDKRYVNSEQRINDIHVRDNSLLQNLKNVESQFGERHIPLNRIIIETSKTAFDERFLI